MELPSFTLLKRKFTELDTGDSSNPNASLRDSSLLLTLPTGKIVEEEGSKIQYLNC